jgi:formylmethanofuran dehydrogenase subunit E
VTDEEPPPLWADEVEPDGYRCDDCGTALKEVRWSVEAQRPLCWVCWADAVPATTLR